MAEYCSPVLTYAGLMREIGGRYARVTFNLPRPGKPILFRVLPHGARHDRVTDDLRFDVDTGLMVRARRAADRTLGEDIAASRLPLHTGAYFGTVGRLLVAVAALLMPLFTVTGFLLYLDRRRRRRGAAGIVRSAEPISGDIIVAYASQTGRARHWAELTAVTVGGISLPLSALRIDRLQGVSRILFVVSTYGDGEAPDAARRFERHVMRHRSDLQGLSYAVLALGERAYSEFCAFGRRLDGWLEASGAIALFDRVEVDGEDETALHQWRTRIAPSAAGSPTDWQSSPFTAWTLERREHLNPGSVGGPVFRCLLTPQGAAPSWKAGAIAEILVGGDHFEHIGSMGQQLPVRREYSIMSIEQSGAVELLVRRVVRDDGSHGLGSGWLTAAAPLGGTVHLRIRDNPGFAPPKDPARPLILIGNGTGLAGLMAHLHERAHCRGSKAWLIFGERNRAHDRLCAGQIASLVRDGVLARFDELFSRDHGPLRYVQDMISSADEDIRDWVDRGASIYVCGSVEGMAPSVDAALRSVLGDKAIDDMTNQGRYCRDIY